MRATDEAISKGSFDFVAASGVFVAAPILGRMQSRHCRGTIQASPQARLSYVVRQPEEPQPVTTAEAIFAILALLSAYGGSFVGELILDRYGV